MSDKKKQSGEAAYLDKTFERQSLADWLSLAQKSLGGAPVDSLTHTTANGLTIEPLYTERPDATQTVEPQPMQRWDNRLMVLGDTAKLQNESLLAGLHGGISSAQIHVDSPEQKQPITSALLSTVLQDVQLEIMPVSLMAGSRFANAAEQMENIWIAHGVTADNAKAAFNADPIGTLATTGQLATELKPLLHDMTKLALRTHISFPQVTSVSVNASCYHNAGASLEQELASSIATASIYMQSMLDAGMDAQAAHDAILFQIACDADTMVNVVKLRALKGLWHHLATQLGVPQPALKLVVETSLRMQSRLDPWVNHLRNVSAATAAAMAAAQSVIIHPHNRIDGDYIDDELEISARVARNVAIILSEESAMTFVHDPMGGSYAIESLTNSLCQSTWQALQTLELSGGLIQALIAGQWQAAIADVQKTRVTRLSEELDVQVGVNRYVQQKQSQSDTRLNQPDAVAYVKSKALLTMRDAAPFEAAL